MQCTHCQGKHYEEHNGVFRHALASFMAIQFSYSSQQSVHCMEEYGRAVEEDLIQKASRLDGKEGIRVARHPMDILRVLTNIAIARTWGMQPAEGDCLPSGAG